MRWVVLGLTLSACTPNWSPASVVDSLRVIGVRAEPPEIRPGGTALLQQLIINPSGSKTTTLWLGCDPDPFNQGRGACGDVTALSDASGLVNTSALPDGVKLIGFNDQAAYSVASTLFDVLKPDDPIRTTGTVGLIVSIAVGEEISPAASPQELSALASRVRDGTTQSQLTLFRVTVSENPNPNHNPVFDSLLIMGQGVAAGANATFWPLINNPLDFTAHDLEAYDELTPGGVEHKTEHITAAWYTTTGRFTQDRVVLDGDIASALTGPGGDSDDPIPDDRRGTLWAVLRDSRGGQAWASWPSWICDLQAPPVSISSVDVGATLVVHGTHLDQAIDVIINGVALSGAYHPENGTWQGTLPTLAPGTYRLDVKGKGCDQAHSSISMQ